jgi:hypothetical protein
MKTMMAVAAFGLATGAAQARLGFSLQECENMWGQPRDAGFNVKVNQPYYTFKAGPKLFVTVILLNNQVQSINYCSPDGRFLANNAMQILQKNFTGFWGLYDDGRGKDTVATWQVSNNEGESIDYAILYSHPDNRGFFHLQVSTELWDAYLRNNGIDRNSNYLNI